MMIRGTLALVAGLVLVGCENFGHVSIGTLTAGYSPEAYEQVVLRTNVGDLEFEAWDQDGIEVDAEVFVTESLAPTVGAASETRDLRVAVEAGVLTIENAHLDANDSDDWYVTLHVRARSAEQLTCASGVGEIRVGGEWRDIVVAAGVGDVRLNSSSNTLSVDVGVGDFRADGTARTVKAEIGTGTARVETSELDSADLSVGVGDVDLIATSLDPAATVQCTTGTGTIDIHVPESFEGALDLDTGTGGVKVQGTPGISIEDGFVSASAAGQIGDGEGRVTATTGVGDISFRRGG